MEVCEEIISYPFVKYKINVSHVTSRNSTAFEWLFLEALIKSNGTEFQNENVEHFFRNYFQIDNPEKLIKPVLKRLYDLQALACPKLTDDISLSELALSDIKVLPLGKEMQQKGLLPGEHSRDTLELVYDVSKNKLITDRKKFSAEAEGISVSAEESSFPEKLVRQYIESQRPKNEKEEKTGQTDKELAEEMLSQSSEESASSKKSKKKEKKNNQKKLDWLKVNTEIDSLSPQKTETCFDNIPCKIQLKDGLVWKIENNKSVELEEVSLEKFENNPPESLENCPLTSIAKPDEEIEQIILFKEQKSVKDASAPSLNKFIDKKLYGGLTTIISRQFFHQENLQKRNGKNKSDKNKKLSTKTIILSGSQKFSVSSENAILLVAVPEKILPPDRIFMSENFSIKVEKFPVKAGQVQKELTFAYLPKNSKENLKKFILPLVEKYYKTEPGLLLLLNEENGLKSEFDSYFEKLLVNCSVKEKAEKIEELNQKAVNLTGKKCISDELVSNLITNKKEVKNLVTDLETARKTIEEYSSIAIVKNQVLRDLLKIVLESLNPTDSVEEIWNLLDFIKEKSPDSVGNLNKQGVLGKLYSKKAQNEVFETAFSGKLDSAHCDFEERVLNLANWYQKIKSIRDDKKLKDALNAWKNNFGNLRKYYGNIESAEKYNREIEAKRTLINSIEN